MKDEGIKTMAYSDISRAAFLLAKTGSTSSPLSRTVLVSCPLNPLHSDTTHFDQHAPLIRLHGEKHNLNSDEY